jgi:ribonuclease HI
LNDIFSNRDRSERTSKWAMELSEYIIDFEKRSAIKSQVLADFMAEWMEPGSATEGEVPKTPWVVYYDGAWGSTGARVAAVLLSPSGIKLCYATRMQFNNESDKCTNNIAEYDDMLLGLRKFRAIGVQKCILCTDSKVVAGQIEKRVHYQGTHPREIFGSHQKKENYFKRFTI